MNTRPSPTFPFHIPVLAARHFAARFPVQISSDLNRWKNHFCFADKTKPTFVSGERCNVRSLLLKLPVEASAVEDSRDERPEEDLRDEIVEEDADPGGVPHPHEHMLPHPVNLHNTLSHELNWRNQPTQVQLSFSVLPGCCWCSHSTNHSGTLRRCLLLPSRTPASRSCRSTAAERKRRAGSGCQPAEKSLGFQNAIIFTAWYRFDCFCNKFSGISGHEWSTKK